MKKFLMFLALSAPLAACSKGEEAKAPAAPQRVEVKVTDHGYTPSEVKATRGQPLTMVFTRTSESTCGEKLVIPAQKIEKDLPLNQPVEVSFTPTAAGTLAFACGMDMMKGSIVVQ